MTSVDADLMRDADLSPDADLSLICIGHFYTPYK
jgi:hypothetical protein